MGCAQKQKAPVFNALVIVNMQNDFLEGGKIGIANSKKIIERINKCRKAVKFDQVYLVVESHPEYHRCFASNNPGAKENTLTLNPDNNTFQMVLPDHCIEGTEGADFPDELQVNANEDVVIKIGTHKDYEAYSAFGSIGDDEALMKHLKEKKITRLFICGLPFDYTVGQTALDAKQAKLTPFILIEATKSRAEPSELNMLQRLKEAGIKMISTSDLQKEIPPPKK
eukprot:TRINITY_DN424_c0_g3_i1.p1 TRINITY_DN424_c0_g3~~TRINITY_DN424_c0_g3_i1.p1  ORF type:complete len:225 (+),score=35.93 TRINITY_DN424_c0_g3_i1:94-768(+)